MRFGLGELDELPSLKEFEALAREALGADEGLAPAEPADSVPAEPGAEMAEGAESAAPADELPSKSAPEAAEVIAEPVPPQSKQAAND